MSTMKYTKDHEWLKIEEGNVAVIGITDYAQNALGDLVFVELPKMGRQVKKANISPSLNRSKPPLKSIRL